MSRKLVYTNKFKKDVKQCAKRNYPMEELQKVLNLLLQNQELPAKYSDHPLKGNMEGYRDLHIKPDWLLLYRLTPDEVILERTGTHSDLF